MINRQRDTIFAPNIKMRVDKYYIYIDIIIPKCACVFVEVIFENG